MNSAKKRLLFACVATAFLFSSLSHAQTALSEITGQVSDQSGAALPGVQITLTNTADGTSAQIVANELGHFYMRALKPGIYDIEAKLEGFKTYRGSGVELGTGQVQRHEFSMEVGDVSTTVEVQAASVAALQTDSAEVSTLVSETVVTELPKITRRTLELIATAPAVTMQEKGGWHTVYVPFFSTAGNPGGRASMFYTDGTSTTFARAQGDGGGMSNFNPSAEWVSEFRTVYNNYSAELGEGMGAAILLTTKSGSNDFNGNLYWFLQNNALDSRTYFAARKNPNQFNNYGGIIGGPIVKNKTHFFVGLDGQRWKQKTPFVLTLPTALQRNGDFSQTFNAAGNLIPIYDPNTTTTGAGGNPTRTQFANNIIPAGRFDPIIKNILDNYVADPNSAGTITGANNFRADARTRDLSHFSQFWRLDHQINQNNRLYFRFSRDDVDPPFYGPYEGTRGQVADPWEEGYTSFGWTTGVKWTAVLSPTTVSDLSFGMTNFAVDRCAMCFNPEVWEADWASKLGLKNLGPDTFPRIDFAGFAAIGGGTWVQQLTYQYMASTSVYETLTHIRGRHNMRLGGGWKRSAAAYASRFWPSGMATFDTLQTSLPGVAATGNGLASGLLGRVSSAQVQEAPAPDMRTWFYTGYFQDDWRVTDNLTLNLGVRYEYDTPKIDLTEGQSLFNFDKTNPVSGTPGVIEFSINRWKTSRVHTKLYKQPSMQFAPRLGFAWTPFGGQNFVVRGGYGMFYVGGDYGDIFWDGPLLGRGTIQNWSSDGIGLIPAFNFSQDGFPLVPTEPLNDAWGAVPIGSRPRVNPKFFWNDRVAGYSQQWNFNIQQRVGSYLFEVAYLANAVRKLPVHATGLNELVPSQRGPGDAQLRRPYPQFGTVNGYGMNGATSNYHASFVSVRKQLAAGLTFTTSYTFAKHLINSSPRSQYYFQQDYGPSPLQRRHRFVFSSVYDLPFGKGRRMDMRGALDKVLGGWTLGSFAEWSSGAPTGTIGTIANTCNCFSRGNQGADLVGQVQTVGGDFDPAAQTWFNTDAFAFSAPYRFGTAGYGIIEAPGFATIDLTIAKRVSIRENYAFEIRGEFFNTLNHTNFTGPNTTFGNPAFGRVTGTLEARRIQLGLKFHF